MRSRPSHARAHASCHPSMPASAQGRTYGTTVANSSESHMLSFGLYRCADALGAYKAAKQVLVDYALGDLVISDVQVWPRHPTPTHSQPARPRAPSASPPRNATPSPRA